jgi:hypothetical protein
MFDSLPSAPRAGGGGPPPAPARGATRDRKEEMVEKE